MKILLHIPTEQYGFVSIEVDKSFPPQEVRELYDEYSRAFKLGAMNGVSPKDFDQFIQNQLSGKGNHTDYIEKLSPAQYEHYQINKRALKRING